MIGWLLVPNYMKENLRHFSTVSAMDAAFTKKSKGAQGTFYLEATLDANRHIHPMAIMHLLSTESTFGYNHLHMGMLRAYGNQLAAESRVLISDGALSIHAALRQHRPNTQRIRDARHLLDDLKSAKARSLFSALRKLPPSRKDEVAAILKKLENDDPSTHKQLTSVPLHHWCQAYMHGTHQNGGELCIEHG